MNREQIARIHEKEAERLERRAIQLRLEAAKLRRDRP